MSISISQLGDAINLSWKAGLSVLVWGPPGIGKSDVIRGLAKSEFKVKRNDLVSKISPRIKKIYDATQEVRPVVDIRLALCNPTDIKGIPVYNQEDRTAVWVMSGTFPVSESRLKELETMLIQVLSDGDNLQERVQAIEELSKDDKKRAAQLASQFATDIEQRRLKSLARVASIEAQLEKAILDQHAILFLDEITQAPAAVQAAAFSLVLDRTIMDYKLPDTVDIVAASNRMTDKAMVNKMPTPLLSRFVHIEIDTPSYEDWSDWAMEAGVHSDIIAYLKFNPESFFTFNPKQMRGESADTADITFACPRTWHFTSKIMHAYPKVKQNDQILEDTIGGCIGHGTAAGFIAWRNHYRKMPDVELILAGKISRNDIEFVREENGSKLPDLSLEYAFTINMFMKMIREASASEDRISRFFEFITHPKTSPEWLAVVFRSVVIADAKLPVVAAMKKSKVYREMATRMMMEGDFNIS